MADSGLQMNLRLNPKLSSRLKSGWAVAALAILGFCLPGCGEDSSSQRTPPNLAKLFADRYANDKAAPPNPLPSEWVVIDKLGRLAYRWNFNKYCLITAKGLISLVRAEGENYLVTYVYESLSSTGTSGSCQGNDQVCLDLIADCNKMVGMMATHLNQSKFATIPASSKPDDALNQLKPSRI